MNIQGISGASFKGIPTSVKEAKNKAKEQPKVNSNEASKDKFEASIGKKVGVGIASFFFPGLGQLINGEGKKGLAFLGAIVGSNLLANVGAKKLANSSPKNSLIVAGLAAIANLTTCIASSVDAVKNANGKEE